MHPMKSEGVTNVTRDSSLPTEFWFSTKDDQVYAMSLVPGAGRVRILALNESAGTVTQAAIGEMELPSVFGLGASFRTRGGRLTLGFEWDRVGYSPILRDTDPGLLLEDGDELHLGAEYVFLRAPTVLAGRLGAWLDPHHRIDYRGGDYVATALYLPGEDEIHLAAGLGAVFKRLQVDLGVDVSDPVSTVSLSTIYSF